MKSTILSLGIILLAGVAPCAAQQATQAAAKEATPVSLDVNPREAFLNISYKLQGGKMAVMADDHKAGSIFIETTSSTLADDTYKIYSADGKTLIATYAVGRKEGTVKMTITKGGAVKTFELAQYLARATSDLERDAVKRKVPVYWLYKNGYSK